jgi:glycerol-3-phosphate acyltransferase PlsY
VWLGFKGGKGVATALGCFCGISPFLGYFTILMWTLAAKMYKMSSLSALFAFVSAAIFCHITVGIGHDILCIEQYVWYPTIVALIILWTHRDNIKRLIKGEEAAISVKAAQ